MEQWQVDVVERLARMETNQEFLKDLVKNLPSAEAVSNDILALKKDVAELKSFKNEIKEKIAYIGGVIVIIGLFVPYAIKWVLDHISWKSL